FCPSLFLFLVKFCWPSLVSSGKHPSRLARRGGKRLGMSPYLTLKQALSDLFFSHLQERWERPWLLRWSLVTLLGETSLCLLLVTPSPLQSRMNFLKPPAVCIYRR